MENELMKIFDEDSKQIGVAARKDVHTIGYWHESFHCWFISNEDGKDYIYLQLRSEEKKDYPNLLDITAAGHLLAHETIEDGIREVKEELGIDVTFDELVPLGVIKDSMINEGFIDKELAHVFLYHSKKAFDEFHLQKEEVSGLFKAKLEHFYDLWLEEKDEIRIEGFKINKRGEKMFLNKIVGKNDLVPHENSYYERVVRFIYKNIND